MKTRRIITIAVLAAISVVLVALIHFPIFPAVAFLEYDPADIPILIGTFAFGPEGKPWLPDRPGLHFSLSHSGELVLCSLSDAELGCDVETPRRVNAALVRRFFHPDEQRWLFSLPQGEQDAAFLRLWTLKESYVKAIGLGLSLPLDAFCVLPEGEGYALTQRTDPRPWQLGSFQTEDCVCSFCALEAPPRLERCPLFD